MDELELKATAYDLASAIKRNAGAAEYLKGVDRTLTAQLLTYARKRRLDDLVPVLDRSGGGSDRKTYIPQVRTTHPTVQRRVDYAGLRKGAPQVYARAVVEVPPVTPYSIRMEVRSGRGKSREWEAWHELGAAAARKEWHERTKGGAWGSPSYQAEVLYKLRAEGRRLQGIDKSRRRRLSDFIAEHDMPLLIPGGDDGMIRAVAAKPTRTADLELIEAEAAQFLTRTPRAGFTTVVFTQVLNDDEEGDQEPFEGF